MKTRALKTIGLLAMALAVGGLAPRAEAEPPNPWSFLQISPDNGRELSKHRGSRKVGRNPKGSKGSQQKRMRRLMRRSTRKKFKF